MRRFSIGLLVLLLTGFVAGCGGASGIEEGMPENATPPPADFDPGGGAVPNMQGNNAQNTVP